MAARSALDHRIRCLPAGSMLASLVLSLTEWRMFTPPQFIGLANYAEMISGDPLYFKRLRLPRYIPLYRCHCASRWAYWLLCC